MQRPGIELIQLNLMRSKVQLKLEQYERTENQAFIIESNTCSHTKHLLSTAV